MVANRTCSVEGCDRLAKARGWCNTHYARWSHHGTTDDPRPTADDRFWSHVDRRGPTECWLWTASTNSKGYGQFSISHDGVNSMVGSHKWAWEQCNGLVPAGLELDHLCRVRRCVNPAHLEAVAHHENLLRGNTITARNAIVTHCPQGHPYDDANTYWDPKGGRRCRFCAYIKTRDRQLRARSTNREVR